MTEKLQALAARFDELEARLAAPGLYDDPQNAAALLREHDRLAPIAAAAHALQAARQAQEEAREMLSDPELKALAQEELAAAKAEIERLSSEVKLLLVPRDPNDDKNVIVEIRGGAGGEESALFAHSLYRMYTMYAEKQGWSVDVLSQSPTELGGCKEIIFQVSGDGAYSRLKFESGVHRVQRVPETESQGRVHTSTVTVAVLPEAEEVDFEIDPADLKIDTFRGQHINKTESAIRITHLPTGVVVECQDERSQHKNRDKAMRVLRTRLFEAEQARQNAAIAAERRSQIGTGDRSERIRTYNFPENRVSDHRIKLTLYKLADFMDGALDEVIEGLAAAERVRLMEEGGS